MVSSCLVLNFTPQKSRATGPLSPYGYILTGDSRYDIKCIVLSFILPWKASNEMDVKIRNIRFRQFTTSVVALCALNLYSKCLLSLLSLHILFISVTEGQ